MPSTKLPPIEILSDYEMRRCERTSLNCLPNIRDWGIGGPFCDALKAIAEGPYIHRKAWEYGMCVMGLHRLGAVHPNAHVLAVAAGYERPFYYFTNHCERVVATDLYDNPDHEGKPDIITNPGKYACFPYRNDRLEVMQMDALNLKFPENSFDITFCLSSIEHYGSRENSKQGMREMHRVTKPGGIVCVATELILNGTTHSQYFTPDEFADTLLDSTPMPLVGGELDLRIARSLVDDPLDVNTDNLMVSPHIVLKDGENVWTSLMCFFQKPQS